jgi:hypothetical protein
MYPLPDSVLLEHEARLREGGHRGPYRTALLLRRNDSHNSRSWMVRFDGYPKRPEIRGGSNPREDGATPNHGTRRGRFTSRPSSS